MSTSPEHDELSELPWPKPAVPGEGVSKAIRGHCTHGICPGRGASAGQRLSASIGISAITIGLLFWLAKSEGEPESTLRLAMCGAAGWGIVLATLLFAGLARPPGKRGSSRWRVAAIIAAPLLFLGYLACVAENRLPFGTFSQGAYAQHALRCGLLTLVIGGLVSAGVLASFRRTDPLTPRISGALAGLAGGMTSALAVGIACPSHETWHLWFAHGFVVVALLLLGWGLGRRVLSP